MAAIKETIVKKTIEQFELVAGQAAQVTQLQTYMTAVVQASTEAVEGAKQLKKDTEKLVTEITEGKAGFTEKMKECTNKAALSKDYDDLVTYATTNQKNLECYKPFKVMLKTKQVEMQDSVQSIATAVQSIMDVYANDASK